MWGCQVASSHMYLLDTNGLKDRFFVGEITWSVNDGIEKMIGEGQWQAADGIAWPEGAKKHRAVRTWASAKVPRSWLRDTVRQPWRRKCRRRLLSFKRSIAGLTRSCASTRISSRARCDLVPTSLVAERYRAKKSEKDVSMQGLPLDCRFR